MWIKCSSLLPKDGMLVMCRQTEGDIVQYYGGLVKKDLMDRLEIKVGSSGWSYLIVNHDSFLSGVEWKEIEKD